MKPPDGACPNPKRGNSIAINAEFMKWHFTLAGTLILAFVAGLLLLLDSPEKNGQVEAASQVIQRVLPAYAERFALELIEPDDRGDVFEVEPANGKIVIRGSSGVAICSGFNYYLKHHCHAFYHFRTGKNLDITGVLPGDFEKIRKISPHPYRYMFNYCTFSYSMAFWDWEQWEKMIDWMALNGINMPLAPMGQELIWQRVYKKYGLSAEDLKDFFVGPAYNAFGRMGCIDGYGGPLPQSWMVRENLLQKKILQRQRQLGMTPVLQGFTGHIPPAFARKNPQLNVSQLKWLDFPETFLLDWEEPVFTAIARDFIAETIREYGSDHLYAIDQFIEMTPASGDTSYLKSMSETIISGITQADPAGTWVLQTWPFNYQREFWTPARVRAYFEGVPDNRMIALELQGESWDGTGWHVHDGWYGKRWIWSVISNFGDQVSLFGNLAGIADNYEKAVNSTAGGNLSGVGLMMEGLDYNPVIYEFVAGLIWETGSTDLDQWKENFVKWRYGRLNDHVLDAWRLLFDHYYTRGFPFERNLINERPGLMVEDIWPSESSVSAIRGFIGASGEFRQVDAYQFDLVNLFRQVFGRYAGHLLHEITLSYRAKDIAGFDAGVTEFIDLAGQLERLLATREEFLLGKWIGDSRKCAANAREERLYEWNARAIITTWGGRRLYGYALKDWAGMYSGYYLPRWEKFFGILRSEISGGDVLDYARFMEDIMLWEDEWVGRREEQIVNAPAGDPVELAGALWAQHGETLLRHYGLIDTESGP
jgi:alpha-N-acetylglucosaminidase